MSTKVVNIVSSWQDGRDDFHLKLTTHIFGHRPPAYISIDLCTYDSASKEWEFIRQ